MELIARAAAKGAGLKRYFDGKPCPSGHISEKLVSNYTCVQCLHERYFAKRKVKRQATSAERQARLKTMHGGHHLPPSKKAAKAIESARYYTGRPCPRGHVAERYTSSGVCSACNRERADAWASTEEGRANRTKAAVRAYQRDVELSRQRERAKRQTNIQHKLRCAIRVRIKRALRGNYKESSALVYLGCTITEARAYIESQFIPGMTWENHSHRGWHIDHITPLASFDMTDEEQRKRAFHFTNLQPLWAVDNMRKGCRALSFRCDEVPEPDVQKNDVAM